MLSIVTLTFNNFEQLVDTINSFAELKNTEVIVINAGDCERTKAFLAESKIVTKHVNERDRGIADGFNKGVKLASGEYIAFVSSGDAIINPSYFYNAQTVFEKDPTIDFIHSNMILDDHLMGRIGVRPPMRRLGYGQPYLHPTMIVRSNVFERVGLFNLSFRIGMDFDLICRMHKAKMKGLYIDGDPVVLMDGQGVSNTRDGKALQEIFRALRQNHLLNFSNAVGMSVQFVKFSTKKALLKLGLNQIVRFVKNRLRSQT
jgi:glycosyltransferase involved in cell wall biosynthesis